MRRLFLKDSSAGDQLDDVYVIGGKQLGSTSTGKPFIKGFISDRTQQVTARMWNATKQIFDFLPEAGFVHLRGHLENYQGNLQFIIESVGLPREGTFDAADLMPTTEKDVPTMCAKLAEMLGSIQNRHLSALVQAYLDDETLMTNFCKAPAAMSMHHAFVGGLLEHTLNAIEVGDAISKFYPGLNRDLLVAGIFLHDIAKTWELCYDCAFSYSDGGQLVGHIVKSAIWVEHKAKEAEAILGEKIPQPLIDVLQHIILSHHGDPAFGAAKLPSTPEALAVSLIDNLDAKLMPALKATRGKGVSGEGNWTEFMKTFNGRLYRPDVAPPDAEIVEAEPAGAGPVVAQAPAAAVKPAAAPASGPAGASAPAVFPAPTSAAGPKPAASIPTSSGPRPAPVAAPTPVPAAAPEAPVEPKPLVINNPLFAPAPSKRR